jgi:hypothetical protein
MYIWMEYLNTTNRPTIVEFWFVLWNLLSLSLFMIFWKICCRSTCTRSFSELSLRYAKFYTRMQLQRYFWCKCNMVLPVQESYVVYCCVWSSGQRESGSDMICTGTRQGNSLSELILVRASICFVPHTKYCYTRYSLLYQYRRKYLVVLRVELNNYGTKKR